MTSTAVSPAGPPQSRGAWMRLHRQARGWSVPELRRQLREAAKGAGDTLPGNECLGVMIRRWEKDSGGVSERYRLHYCRALGIPIQDFGTAPPPVQAGVSRSVPARAIPVPAAPLSLDEDEAAELTRLRREHADLTARYSEFRRGLLAWVCKAIQEDDDLDVT